MGETGSDFNDENVQWTFLKANPLIGNGTKNAGRRSTLFEPLSATKVGEREGPNAKCWEGEVVVPQRPTSPGSLPLATLSLRPILFARIPREHQTGRPERVTGVGEGAYDFPASLNNPRRYFVGLVGPLPS
jgi:hypothetical protein